MDLSWVKAILKYSHHSKLTLPLPTEALVRNTLQSQGKLLQGRVKHLKIGTYSQLFFLKIILKIWKKKLVSLIYSIWLNEWKVNNIIMIFQISTKSIKIKIRYSMTAFQTGFLVTYFAMRKNSFVKIADLLHFPRNSVIDFKFHLYLAFSLRLISCSIWPFFGTAFNTDPASSYPCDSQPYFLFNLLFTLASHLLTLTESSFIESSFNHLMLIVMEKQESFILR